MPGSKRIRPQEHERQQREVAEQQRQLQPRHADPSHPDLRPADQREQAEQSHIVELVPCRIDVHEQTSDHRECDIARPHRQLQALCLAAASAACANSTVSVSRRLRARGNTAEKSMRSTSVVTGQSPRVGLAAVDEHQQP